MPKRSASLWAEPRAPERPWRGCGATGFSSASSCSRRSSKESSAPDVVWRPRSDGDGVGAGVRPAVASHPSAGDGGDRLRSADRQSSWSHPDRRRADLWVCTRRRTSSCCRTRCCAGASGREIILGLPIILVALCTGHRRRLHRRRRRDRRQQFLAVPGGAWRPGALPVELAAREREQVRLREREQLARELHDTVAHHVSAIAVRAQAGRVVAAADPEAALDSLRLIEAEASRALTEMRTMVGALRDGEQRRARSTAWRRRHQQARLRRSVRHRRSRSS